MTPTGYRGIAASRQKIVDEGLHRVGPARRSVPRARITGFDEAIELGAGQKKADLMRVALLAGAQLPHPSPMLALA